LGATLGFRTYVEGIMIHWILIAIIGLIVGAIAKLLMPGKDPGGIWITMLIGIVGSMAATFLGKMVGWYRDDQSAGFIMSVLGAMLILFIYRLFKGRTASA
jgi:uncharacterized membrane protein YeaQ/YmgE (transglycosylase-associated protein family)